MKQNTEKNVLGQPRWRFQLCLGKARPKTHGRRRDGERGHSLQRRGKVGPAPSQHPLRCPRWGGKIVPYPSRFFWRLDSSNGHETDGTRDSEGTGERLLLRTPPADGPRNAGMGPEPRSKMARPPPSPPPSAEDKRRCEGGEQSRGRGGCPGRTQETGMHIYVCTFSCDRSDGRWNRPALPGTGGRHTLQVATSLTNVNDRSQRHSCCLDYPGSHT